MPFARVGGAHRRSEQDNGKMRLSHDSRQIQVAVGHDLLPEANLVEINNDTGVKYEQFQFRHRPELPAQPVAWLPVG